MKVKKYLGETMQDAIFKVKSDLGSDAIILNTRKLKKGSFCGLFGKNMIEVLAALEEKKDRKQEDTKTLQEIDDLKNMIQEMHKQLQLDLFSRNLTDEMNHFYTYLNKQGVSNDFSEGFITQLNKIERNDQEGIVVQAERKLKKFLGSSQPILFNNSQKIVSLIGPTGVGKTTTIAKLAAKFALDQGKRVGLITTDTYRIAAVQQLQTYSDIINIPLKVVYDEMELARVIKGDFKEYDLVLIDTTGVSWNNRIYLGRLKRFMELKLIDEVHLIISLTTKTNDIKAIIDRFKILNPDKLILSKLDETISFGDIINIKYKYKIPYSYITFGQDVPDDIKVAEPDLLIKYIFGDLYV